jgi:hypothetical protein
MDQTPKTIAAVMPRIWKVYSIRWSRKVEEVGEMIKGVLDGTIVDVEVFVVGPDDLASIWIVEKAIDCVAFAVFVGTVPVMAVSTVAGPLDVLEGLGV